MIVEVKCRNWFLQDQKKRLRITRGEHQDVAQTLTDCVAPGHNGRVLPRGSRSRTSDHGFARHWFDMSGQRCAAAASEEVKNQRVLPSVMKRGIVSMRQSTRGATFISR